MDDIYSSAETVLVWLGPEAQDSAMAMRHIQSFAISLSNIEDPPLWSNLEEHGLPHHHHPVWPAIGRLYNREWFRRLWTFQESVLARNMKIFCGEESVDWTSFSQVGSDLEHTWLFSSAAVSNQDKTGTEGNFRAVSDVSWAKMARKMVGDDMAEVEAKLDPTSPEGYSIQQQSRPHTLVEPAHDLSA